MVEIPELRIGQRAKFEPLPPYVTAHELLVDALPVLDPPSRISVTDAAERYMRVEVQGAWQSFDRDVTPYMVEPSDMTQSRLYKAVAFVGPSQSGKTKALESVLFHAVTCDQEKMLIVHMTRGDRDSWVEDKVDPTIRFSPEIFDRMGKARDDSTFSRKRFRGMRVRIGYPTPTILSGGTYRNVLLTDFDHMPVALGGKDNPEGRPFNMALQRIKSYRSRGSVFVESTPAWPVTDPSWRPRKDAPHEMPPVAAGIVLIYNEGTRGRWYWECPDCGTEFEPRFDRLQYDAALEPGEAGETAEMGCPHCGSLIAERHKMELNRAGLRDKGGWRHETREGGLAAIGDEDLRKSMIASYGLNGAAATFNTWSEMVAKYQAALRQAETLGDDLDLATVHYTDIGVSHARLVDEDEDTLTVEFLRDHLQPAEKGIAPEWTRFVTITVDVQGTYFPVQVTAWGVDGQSQVVDRFDLTQPPKSAPNSGADEDGNRRAIAPHRYAEDWAVLKPLSEKVIPVAGQGYGLLPIAVVVDYQGLPGVSDNAEVFWRGRRKAGEGSKWFLSRGQGGFNKPFRVKYETPETGSKGKKARSIRLLSIATDRVKDTLSACLRKAEGGKGALWLPEWMRDDEARLKEFIAEARIDGKGWELKTGETRNEGTDLWNQARAIAEHKGMLGMSWDNPRNWALGGPENINAVALETDAETARQQKAARDTKRAKPKRINFLKR